MTPHALSIGNDDLLVELTPGLRHRRAPVRLVVAGDPRHRRASVVPARRTPSRSSQRSVLTAAGFELPVLAAHEQWSSTVTFLRSGRVTRTPHQP